GGSRGLTRKGGAEALRRSVREIIGYQEVARFKPGNRIEENRSAFFSKGSDFSDRAYFQVRIGPRNNRKFAQLINRRDIVPQIVKQHLQPPDNLAAQLNLRPCRRYLLLLS